MTHLDSFPVIAGKESGAKEFFFYSVRQLLLGKKKHGREREEERKKGEKVNVNSGHYVPPAMPKGSACTPLVPIRQYIHIVHYNIVM